VRCEEDARDGRGDDDVDRGDCERVRDGGIGGAVRREDLEPRPGNTRLAPDQSFWRMCSTGPNHATATASATVTNLSTTASAVPSSA
jgi:hypothetical protein